MNNRRMGKPLVEISFDLLKGLESLSLVVLMS